MLHGERVARPPRDLPGPARVGDDSGVSLRWAYLAAFVLVAACWIAFFARFIFGKRPSSGEATKTARLSILGIAIQGLGYAAVWMLERPRFGPIVPLPGALGLLPPVLAVGLAFASLWLALASIRTLGREWSFEARLVEGHRLVTAGPYAIVRHPIYSAMLGMLLATGLLISHWIGLVAGVAIFALGTWIRVRSEEELLRGRFGGEYDAYARRVPAIVPLRFGR